MPNLKYTPVHFVPIKNTTVAIDLTSHRFGKLTAFRSLGFSPLRQKTYWLCRCDCGNEIAAPTKDLLQGRGWQSCGCAPRKPSTVKHGQHSSGAYKSWQSMRQRCENPKNTSYARYGRRGIAVCAHWRESFENFFADMGERPKGTTLERKDNDGNYEPNNCVWATRKEQGQNRSTTTFITYKGETKTLKAWAEQTGLPIMKRHAANWGTDRMMTEPSRYRARLNHSTP